MFKLFFVLLIGCTAIIASPINRKNDSSEESGEFEVVPLALRGIQESFGKSYSKIGDVIVNSLKDVFNSIEERLDSKKFRNSVDDLKKLSEKIFNEENEIQGDERTKIIIEEQLQRINDEFEKMLEKGVKYMKKHNYRTVDATHFKFAVDGLKNIIGDLY